MANENDKKFVVVENGQRISGKLHETSGAAQAEAEVTKKDRPVTEGQQPSAPAVKQNLLG